MGKNIHDLHFIWVEFRSYTSGKLTGAMSTTIKRMILTHGECERSSIVLMF